MKEKCTSYPAIMWKVHNLRCQMPQKEIQSSHKAIATWSRLVKTQTQWIAKSLTKEISSKTAFSLIKLVNNVNKNIPQQLQGLNYLKLHNKHRVVISK